MNTGTTAICAEARRALESHNVTVAIAMLEAELNGQADAALHSALAVSYFQNEQYELAAQHYAAALKFELQNSDWRDMLAVAQANAMAAAHVFVPELHYFDREQLLAPPEKPTLPAPLPSPAYQGLSTRFRVALGNDLGVLITLVMHAATKLWDRFVGYRDAIWTNWYRRPMKLAILTLAYMRDQLNAHNLKSSYPAGALTAFQAEGLPPPPGTTHFRTADGSWNNLSDSKEGAAGTRFLRNIDATQAETGAQLLTPNSREISLRLLSRPLEKDSGVPVMKEVPFLNILAACWIQFMNGDWINHGDIRFTDAIEIDLPPDDPARARHWQTKMFFLVAAMSLSPPSFAQQTVTADPYRAVLHTDLETIAPAKPVTLDIFVTDVTSMAPRPGLAVIASLSMPVMSSMALVPPKVTPGAKPGHYRLQLTFPQAGEYKLDLNVKSAGNRVTLSFPITASTTSAGAKNGMQGPQGAPEMPEIQMKASLGDWSANREGSGTSWQPDASPMFMKMLPSFGGFDFSTMGAVQAGYVDAGGKRGDKDPFSVSMIMLMGRRDLGGGTLGLHLMTSLDPFINGRKGVPNLFQNGFTVHGVDIGDRKDPHNVFAELALSYSHPLSNDWTGFIYAGPVGDPALGNVMFLHRTSGLEVPEAPISHDWFDGTHISFGVVTLGLVYQDKWKLEGSAFNSAEPGAALYGIGRFKLNSASGRLSYNPSRDWSFSTSYGFLKSDVTEYRFTFSAAYSHELPDGDNFSTTAYFGQNIVQGSAKSNAWLAEATYYHARDSFFARFERVDKDELIDVPPGNYTINKLLFGDVHNFFTKDQFDYGVGAYVGVYCFPSSLNPFYGTSPLTFGIFLRIRPSQNRHASGAEMQHGNP